jgi:hypothetical protein
MNWIHLGQDKDQWRALVNTVSFIKRWEILEQISDRWLLKEDSSPFSLYKHDGRVRHSDTRVT